MINIIYQKYYMGIQFADKIVLPVDAANPMEATTLRQVNAAIAGITQTIEAPLANMTGQTIANGGASDATRGTIFKQTDSPYSSYVLKASPGSVAGNWLNLIPSATLWSAIQNTPTTLAGYGVTNGMALVPAASSGHVATFNADGQVVDGGAAPSIATTSVAGLVKPDGTTIEVDAGGVISVVGGGLIQANGTANFPVTGNSGSTYVDISSSPAQSYYWNGIGYSAISAQKYKFTLNTSATSYTITHNLNNANCIIQLNDIVNNIQVQPDISSIGVNSFVLTFAVAPAANQMRVLVMAI